MTIRTAGLRRCLVGLGACGALVLLAPTAAHAALPGASSQLTRAPYLTDLTAHSVQVTWTTVNQSRGRVRYGTPSNCTANTVVASKLGNPITINGVREYQNTLQISGLTAGTTYCYRVYTGAATPVDLLGTNASPRFTTLASAQSSSAFTFVVFGDWGDTTNSGVNNGTLNTNQARLMSLIASSGARFAITTGDTAYPMGSQTNYGDLNQAGVNLSSVFGPSYWAVPGQRIPLFSASGNHGHNATFLTVWPQPAVTAASSGIYAMVGYPSIDGTRAGTFPTSYYAFTTGGARFYVLDASWLDTNTGSATGGACGAPCAEYQVDHDAHWTQSSAEYQWLARDLAAHPGGVKLAFFHYPLRSDGTWEPADLYLQNRPGTSGSLEQLLRDGGVDLVFNGHAHTYQRFRAPAGGLPSYVVGGGGGKLVSVGGSGCSSVDAYAIGWTYATKHGSACGAAPVPTSDAQVQHFLKVRVSGSTVTVTPINALGHSFDAMTYSFAAAAPIAPVAPAGGAAPIAPVAPVDGIAPVAPPAAPGPVLPPIPAVAAVGAAVLSWRRVASSGRGCWAG